TLGVLLGIRWLWLYFAFFEQTGRSHIPSLILTAILLLMGSQLWIFGIVADVMSVNRKLLEDVQLRLRRAEIESHTKRQRQRELL
ncbi:MAG: glycosyltransferase family 2 protein, partial [Cyanobacteria bacterium J06629_9]